jgi:ribose transport system permease protein
MAALLRRYGTFVAVVLVIGYFWLELPSTFLTGRNLLNISQQMSMLAVVAATMTVVMAMGDFDLSVGSMASFAGVVARLHIGRIGTVGGRRGAGRRARGRRRQRSARRLCRHPAVHRDPWSNDRLQRTCVQAVGRPDPVRRCNPARLLGLCARRRSFVFNRPRHSRPYRDCRRNRRGGVDPARETVVGRRLYAIGGNTEAARLAGVPVRPLRLAAFGIAGLGAAGAGLMYASRVASANPTQGAGLMLDAIAAVFLGQSMTEEGEPRVLATVAGVLILGIIGNGLTQLNVDSYVRDILTGSIVIAAVAVSSFGKTRAR